VNDAEKLNALIEKNDGLILTREVTSLGIHRQTIATFVENGKLSKVRAGVYSTPGSFDDEMYRLQGICRVAIFSHDTALFVHDLSDRSPLQYTVTVPRGFNQDGLRRDNLKVISIRKEWHELGVVIGKTMYGRDIRVYDTERSLCDCLNPRNQVDLALTTDAFKRYTAKREKNIPKLMEYAALFGVDKKVRTYLEVLL